MGNDFKRSFLNLFPVLERENELDPIPQDLEDRSI